MHSIRSAARRSAWYDNDPKNKTYNFFGRINTNQSRTKDLERDGRVLTHISTENDAFSPTEAARRDEFSLSEEGAKRHGTFPAGPNGNRPTSRNAPIGDIDEHEKGKGIEDYEKGKRSATHDSVATSVPTPAATFEDNSVGTHKRRKFHVPKFFGKKKDGKKEELERTRSEESEHKKKHPKIPVMRQVKAVFASWINILLVFVPVGLAMEFGNVNGILSFVMNFIAIIPLAAILSFATEELAFYVGDTFGGLLNATFGNATELIVSIIALTQGKVTIVKTSLIGSILSNLLLVLGMCFFLGGLNRMEQFFNITVAQTAASLLALAIGALVTPTAFRIFSNDDRGVLPLSRAAALLLLLTYLAYLFFQLRTHIDMYNEPSQKSKKQNLMRKKPAERKQESADVDASKAILANGVNAGAAAGRANVGENGDTPESATQNSTEDDDEPEDEHVPQLTAMGGLITLAIATALIAVTSDGMVSGIDAIKGPISEEFIGLILVPIVGNAAEHATAVTVAIKDKMDLAIGVAVGSSLQIALLLIPVMVVLFWIGVGAPNDADPMDLNFDGFQIVVLFIAIFVVNYVIQDGRSHWLEGVMLMITYIIFAVAAWYYPVPETPA